MHKLVTKTTNRNNKYKHTEQGTHSFITSSSSSPAIWRLWVRINDISSFSQPCIHLAHGQGFQTFIIYVYTAHIYTIYNGRKKSRWNAFNTHLQKLMKTMIINFISTNYILIFSIKLSVKWTVHCNRVDWNFSPSSIFTHRQLSWCQTCTNKQPTHKWSLQRSVAHKNEAMRRRNKRNSLTGAESILWICTQF